MRRPPIPGLREQTFSVDTLGEASISEEHLLSLVSLPSSPARNAIVVEGGGFTRIEIAAELPSRLRSILGVPDVRTVIVEQASQIDRELSSNPRTVILCALNKQGVEMNLGSAVASVDKRGVVTSTGERIGTFTVLWTAGLEATPLTQQIPGAKDNLGRIQVDANLRVPSAKDISWPAMHLLPTQMTTSTMP